MQNHLFSEPFPADSAIVSFYASAYRYTLYIEFLKADMTFGTWKREGRKV